MSGINVRARWEVGVIIGLLVVLLAGIYPALRHARREQRDGIRRTEVIEAKTDLEQYFNEHEKYPVEFDVSPHLYVVEAAGEEEALAWYVRAELENLGSEKAGFDDEFNVYYRVVVSGGKTFYDVCGGTNTCGVKSIDE